LQSWVQEQQQAAPAASNCHTSTTCLAEHVPPLDDSGDFLNQLLLSDYDFTNTLGTEFFDLESMPTGDAATMGVAQMGDDALFDWDQANAGLMPASMASNGSEIRTTSSSPVHMISPISSGSSSERTDTFSFSLNNSNPPSNMSSSKKRTQADFTEVTSTPSSSSRPEETERVNKRQRNTEAARRYRQRKLDRVSELEEALAEMTRERDELKLKLARSEAEADVLRGMVRKN
jgi:hypothetical protein